jgi:hypothetical protein
MKDKEIHTLASFLEDVTEKVKAASDEQEKIATVLVDLTDELKECMKKIQFQIDDGLAKVKLQAEDPNVSAMDGYRELGRVEGLHDASVILKDATLAVMGRIHGDKQ